VYKRIRRPEPPALFVRPTTLDEALQRLSLGARVFAGGTDLMTGAGEAEIAGEFVDVSRLAALRGISHAGKEIRIGGAATWSEIAREDLPSGFAALQAAAREVGAIQIQNRGTIAGNLCNASPAADGVPPLMALDAEVELVSRRGARRLPLQRFLIGPRRTALAPDEILSSVVIRKPSDNLRSAFLKLGARRYLVISIAMVAVALEIERGAVAAARVAVGACSPVALRLSAAERRLIGQPAETGLGEVLRAEDFEALAPIDDIRAPADYRRAAALTLTRRAVELCLNAERGGVV
jgi:CO/xanthine dehydrogenase FAD-binding subunit